MTTHQKFESEGNVQILLNALRGIGACAPACGCCEMHRHIATKALAEYARLVRQSKP
jgi:hypothetical protein